MNDPLLGLKRSVLLRLRKRLATSPLTGDLVKLELSFDFSRYLFSDRPRAVREKAPLFVFVFTFYTSAEGGSAKTTRLRSFA